MKFIFSNFVFILFLIFGILITVGCSEGNDNKKNSLWKRGIREDFEAADQSFSKLLDAYDKVGDKDSLERVFERNSKLYQKKINESLNKMNELGRRGEVSQEEANQFINKMKEKREQIHKKHKLLENKFEEVEQK